MQYQDFLYQNQLIWNFCISQYKYKIDQSIKLFLRTLSFIFQIIKIMKKIVLSYDQEFKKKRVLSAQNLCHGTQRPFTALSQHKETRQSVPNLFLLGNKKRNTSQQQNNTQSTLLVSKQSILNFNAIDMLKYRKQATPATTLQKQDLFAENLRLKKQINVLENELSIVRGKFQAKTSRYNDMELNKSTFCLGNKSHMITGVKRQYETLKKQQDELKKQYKQLHQKLLESNVPQLQIYIANLENENERLKSKIENIINSEQKIRKITSQSQFHSSADLNQIIINLEEQVQELSEKYREKECECSQQKQIIAEKDSKIGILQKMMIDRENKKHRQKRNVVGLQRELKAKQKKIEDLLGQIEIIKKCNMAQSQQMKNSMTGEIYTLKNEIQNKSKIIQNLESHGKQLQATLRKLKLSHLENNSSFKSKDMQYSNFTNSLHKSSIAFNFPNQSNIGHTSSSNARDEQLTQSVTITKNFITNTIYAQNITQEEEYVEFEHEFQQKKRERILASVKYSEDAKRLKKVKIQDIKDIVAIMKLRIIFTQTTIEDLKKLLNYQEYLRMSDEADEAYSITDSVKWQQEYINTKQLKNILKNEPLSLDHQGAVLIARYIVQDPESEGYVYDNENNEQNREIAKSILKALIGQYSLPQESTKTGVQEFLKKYGANLQAALSDLYPDKEIPEQNFYELLKTLGMQASDRQKEYLVAKMSLHSMRLNSLKYQYLF